MQRLKEILERTNVSIDGEYYCAGVDHQGHGRSHYYSPHGAYDSIKSSHDIWTSFNELVLKCKDNEYQLKDVTERSERFTVKGKIKGVEVDKEVHSLVELARVLRDYGVDVHFYPLIEQDRAEELAKLKEGKPDKVIELHLHGLYDGKKVEDQNLHSTAEIVNFLNAHVKGVKYRAVAENEQILTVSELEEKLAQSRLQGRREGFVTGVSLMVGEQENVDEPAVANSVDEYNQPRIMDVTDGDPDEKEMEPRMKL
jgi:hypothetical protein